MTMPRYPPTRYHDQATLFRLRSDHASLIYPSILSIYTANLAAYVFSPDSHDSMPNRKEQLHSSGSAPGHAVR